MPSYDASHYHPPAPVAQVTLRDITSGTLLPNIFLLVDTGANITLIPKNAAERLGLQPLDGKEYQLLGFDGTQSLAQAVDLDMIFLNKAYRGRYLLIDSDHGVLGRDVLSNVVLLFNGPHQEWNEQSSA
ncbi:MAG TPA: retropepsin-like aspartic protease [Phycisphaerae bacterium]|nr:retropepsin-like aspartic protease [Phycisphaerae bacterium]